MACLDPVQCIKGICQKTMEDLSVILRDLKRFQSEILPEEQQTRKKNLLFNTKKYKTKLPNNMESIIIRIFTSFIMFKLPAQLYPSFF